jgi:type I restriction enzyme S subunit
MEELPEGWARAKLGELASPSSEKVEPKEKPDARYLSLEHIEPHTGRILGFGYGTDVNSTKAVFRAGDVLYGKLRPYLNKVSVPDFGGICSTDILVFPRKPWIDSDFLRRFLSTSPVVEFANHNSSGVQLPRIQLHAAFHHRRTLPPAGRAKANRGEGRGSAGTGDGGPRTAGEGAGDPEALPAGRPRGGVFGPADRGLARAKPE